MNSPEVKPNAPALFSNILLGIGQIILWGGSFFLLAILAKPIMQETGWSPELVYGSLSLALLLSGLLAPTIGKKINSQENYHFLLYSGFVIGAGLVVLSLSTHIALFITGWVIIGIGMAMGLYDTLFASLGKKYGTNASKAITQITLISGFCTTLVWPALSILLEYFDWRTTCQLYAVLLFVSIFPIHYYTLAAYRTGKVKNNTLFSIESTPATPKRPTVYYFLLFSFTISAVLMTAVSLHLIDILLDRKLPKAVAIGLGALLGPSQVGVRILEVILPKRSPVKTSIMSAVGVLAGLGLLLFFPQMAFLGIIMYGLGNGMRSILRGTLPLYIFGSGSYASIMGTLARPPLIAQAFTPFIGGFLIQHMGIFWFLAVLCLMAGINVVLTFGIQKSLKVREPDIGVV
ncbi:MFS transporter [Adhaeribacter aquaticus]|uniref:MFS transporter n=1 Tax=Adhaeribacter aquaticus TaxID=299567 RepID=UPI0012FA17A1|nr:MFS transporter [Adhaeribacter aquaticus]